MDDWKGNLTDEELFDQWSGLIIHVLRKRFPSFRNSEDTIEDLMQEGSIGLWNAIRTYKPETNVSFKAYACICISREMYKWWHGVYSKMDASNPLIIMSLDNESEDDNGKPFIPDSFGYKDEKLYLDDWLNSLTDKQRNIVELRMAGYSYSEIGELLGCSRQCVQQALTTERNGAVRKKYNMYVTKL